jgi:hypothetical protein
VLLRLVGVIPGERDSGTGGAAQSRRRMRALQKAAIGELLTAKTGAGRCGDVDGRQGRSSARFRTISTRARLFRLNSEKGQITSFDLSSAAFQVFIQYSTWFQGAVSGRIDDFRAATQRML